MSQRRKKLSPEEAAQAVRTAQAANRFMVYLDKLPATWTLTGRSDPRPVQEQQQEADEELDAMRGLLEQNQEERDELDPG